MHVTYSVKVGFHVVLGSGKYRPLAHRRLPRLVDLLCQPFGPTFSRCRLRCWSKKQIQYTPSPWGTCSPRGASSSAYARGRKSRSASSRRWPNRLFPSIALRLRALSPSRSSPLQGFAGFDSRSLLGVSRPNPCRPWRRPPRLPAHPGGRELSWRLRSDPPQLAPRGENRRPPKPHDRLPALQEG